MTYTRDAACRPEALVKKCASCSKDLPDAALHCVFCGAKQAPAPAQAGLQKTVMGYSAQEMLAQMKAQGVPPGTPGAPPPSAPAPTPAPALFPPPAVAMPPAIGSSAPTMFDPNARPMNPPMNQPPMNQPPPSGPRGNVDATLPPQGFPQGFNANAGAIHIGAPGGGPKGSVDATLPPQGFPQGFNAASEARAQAHALGMNGPRGSVDKTMMPQMAPTGMPHAPAPNPGAHPGSTPLDAPVFGPSSGPIPAHPALPTPMTPMPGSTSLAPSGGDPLSGLRTWSLVFGILVLITFLLPAQLDPLLFHFSGIGDVFGAGIEAIVGKLLFPVIGLLAIVFGALPLGTAARGAACALIGLGALGGLFALSGHSEWQDIASTFGMVFLLAGLVIRGAYHGSMIARILVTIGVLAVLAPSLVPVGDGGVPIVDKIQGLGEGSTAKLVETVFELAATLLAIASLLAWLPRTSGGGAKVFFWSLLVIVALTPWVGMVIDSGTDIFKTPSEALAWADFFAMFGLAGYGLGALLGKITE